MRTIGGKIGNDRAENLKNFVGRGFTPQEKADRFLINAGKQSALFACVLSARYRVIFCLTRKNLQEISDLISEFVLNGPLIGAGQESTKKSQKKFPDSFPKRLQMVRIQVTGNQ
jgi:hypothetical protein